MTKTTTSLFAVLAIASSAMGGTSAPAKSGKACEACTAAPEESSHGITLEAGYHTHYLYRGVLFGENWVDGGVDFTLPLTEATRLDLDARYGFLAGEDSVLNDLAGTDLSYQRMELGASVVTNLGDIELGAGYRYYWHDGDLANILEDSHEVGVMAATQLGMVTLGLGAHYDITNEGWYLEARAATEIKICDMLSFVPSVGIGYAIDYDWQLVSDASQLDGFTAVSLSLSAPIKVTKNLTITPYISASLPVDALDDAGEDEELFGGVSISFKF